jgi:hypothetical protein
MKAKELRIIGWREWVCLPDLGIPQIKAKIDTGARTSALHAFRVDCFREKGQTKVRFEIHPFQRKKKPIIQCVANLKEMRCVTDSGGHREERPVIETIVQMGIIQWPIEITLTSRDDMRFRMLLGRTALQQRLIINPSVSYQLGKRLKKCT